ncbi:hypothetical protein [Nucisporomicrobium flavum]|uniref:hypothetical protein n=1 Tax=Nucisporomicrobium flavum TaxID=2785915 RepID=UPI0018F3F660|nr:hypothetical protein [Nucisporomicrobium flavum]
MRHLRIDRPGDRAEAARRIAAGAMLATAFGNFYALVAEPSRDSLRRVNRAKGRPADQVGSATTTPERLSLMFDWQRLPPGADPAALHALMAELTALGPIGFRGPAAGTLPPHLTEASTAQVVVPGTRCPSNAFFAEAMNALGTDHLYITSANHSRHSTGRDEEPAHWTADGIAADFAHLDGFTVLAHDDEQAARDRHPRHLPMSVTLASFHRAPGVLTVERHGSLHVDDVRDIAARHGHTVELAASARHRLPQRRYERLEL